MFALFHNLHIFRILQQRSWPLESSQVWVYALIKAKRNNDGVLMKWKKNPIRGSRTSVMLMVATWSYSSRGSSNLRKLEPVPITSGSIEKLSHWIFVSRNSRTPRRTDSSKSPWSISQGHENSKFANSMRPRHRRKPNLPTMSHRCCAGLRFS